MAGRFTTALALTFLLTLSAPLIAPMNAVAQVTPERDGFTMLLNLGLGVQDDRAIDGSQGGLAGLNLGIGGHLNEKTVLWFRVSGTTVVYETAFGDVTQSSGFGGPAIQYWASPRLAVEGGVGAGFWAAEDTDEAGLGVMVAGNYVIWTNGPHSLNLGVEWAAAFTDPETVHSFGVVFGWQKN